MTLTRAGVLRRIDAAFPADPVVLTLGGTAREMVAVAGRRPNHLVNLDAMGQTVGVALGLALGLRGTRGGRVVAVEGDGSLLMGLSVLSTAGHLKPDNLVVLLLDNGVYLATGGQPTAAAGADLVAMALACGWAGAREVRTGEELTAALDWAREAAGPLLVRVFVGTEQIRTDYLLADPAILAEDFRRWLRAPTGGPADV
ncbi:thiamine pyrophosphate-dependent enzyme [Phytohabitans sp. ZYX-F-186]|uniref:Thiamine pyrophosphate-dependent enzyme n=1 Tax=Phytohabitans maris TaxID=3071409 RepID=A0ABU0ZMB1_9ACTN|nr:thiamine pyrophosphate-dependent enzyme [Phytohabitans sp. ZYX-F-186]MDQ7908173.1 thiamine pyrophosphate-dependent enzyme [Phytohabitans sp. ZYX-F-186]